MAVAAANRATAAKARIIGRFTGSLRFGSDTQKSLHACSNVNYFTSHTHLMLREAAFGRSFCLRTGSWIDFTGTRYVLEPAIPGAPMARMNRPPRNRSR
jgi:hypothetical protein